VPQEDLHVLYSAASALVFPSLFEGFGIPLIEAMACGCPIAAARATSIPEVTNGSALLFDPLSPEDIADAIHAVLTDRGLRTDLAARGYRQVQPFDWKAIVPRLARIYEEFAA
jgi:glycosyltransferase involved in cell wall biosynthesis